jgi:hypothetical protein
MEHLVAMFRSLAVRVLYLSVMLFMEYNYRQLHESVWATLGSNSFVLCHTRIHRSGNNRLLPVEMQTRGALRMRGTPKLMGQAITVCIWSR